MKIPFLSQRKNVAAVEIPARERAQKTLDPVDFLFDYHEQTKHNYHRFARSLGYLDWDTQPDPFRRFAGAPFTELPLLPEAGQPYYDDCFSPGKLSPEPLTQTSLSRFLRNSLAISAWKRYEDSRWALRVNPSSGNLHPTEGYLILGSQIPELSSGVYHYAPAEHGVEQRASFSVDVFQKLTADFPPGTFFAGLTSIHWREAWKYGERAYRYCQHDLGHALAALRISAAVLGWKLVLLDQLSDDQISLLLGLNRPEDFAEAEDEHPGCIAAVVPDSGSRTGSISEEAVATLAASHWFGRANRLSATHVEWEIIDEAARHSWKPSTQHAGFNTPIDIQAGPARKRSAERIIQKRRSCLALDGLTGLDVETFYFMMKRVVPGLQPIPFDALQYSALASPCIHLALFVHRIDGLDPGLYMLVRHPALVETLKQNTHPDFVWKKPPGCPEGLDLYLLRSGDVQAVASSICCGQDIGGDGAFAVAMLAEFHDPIRNNGAWLYRRLFWETGIIGQVLYLEAEAAGIRSTGIGCFFDDPMHETLGLRDRKFQSLYHFTVGGPVEDARLTTEPPYERS